MKNLFLIIVCMITVLTSCKKENEVKNDGLIGKWQLVATLDSFNGGSTWVNVPAQAAHTLEFKTDGSFLKLEIPGGINAICTGEYLSLPDNMIKVNSPCNPPNEMIKISALSPTQIILDRHGIEGIIKFKYKAVK
jgi:hypothetical protein